MHILQKEKLRQNELHFNKITRGEYNLQPLKFLTQKNTLMCETDI